MVRETGVQSQIESYQRLRKWFLIPPCLTLSIIRYVSRVKWSNPGKGVASSLHLGVVAIEKGAFGSPSTAVTNFTLLTNIYIYIYIYIYICVCVCVCVCAHARKQNKSDTYVLKFLLSRWVSSWLCGRISGWRKSQPG